MRLNIGSDTLVLPRERWINHDIRKVHPDIIELDVRQGLPYSADSVEEIYGGNFFDHLSLYEGLQFLGDCHRVLKSGGAVKLSLMDTDKIINAYLYDTMNQFNKIQPSEYSAMREKSLKFATFLLGNLAKGEKEYSGHKMLYTPSSIKEVASQVGLTTKYLICPPFDVEPWTVSDKNHQSHCFYVELIK